uniref:Uncharacterized protein n=1 Tax=Octopus bimaculoides TaxID=37653 RepID=A0A0L8G7Z3_OCTBM
MFQCGFCCLHHIFSLTACLHRANLHDLQTTQIYTWQSISTEQHPSLLNSIQPIPNLEDL